MLVLIGKLEIFLKMGKNWLNNNVFIVFIDAF